MQPTFVITIRGEPVNLPQLNSLSLTDKRGLEADELEITLSDENSKIHLPQRGVAIGCQLGWKGQSLIDKGQFIVDEIEHSGAPDQLRIRARSADFREGFKQQKERSWHKLTLEKIIATIAQENALQPRVANNMKGLFIKHLDQTNESDANFISRLGQRYDAVATVKNGYLLFLPIGQAKTISGKPLQPFLITRQMGDQHHYREADRQSHYTGVKVFWYNARTAEKEAYISGQKGHLRTLRETYPNRVEARRIAQTTWQKLTRGQKSMSLTLAQARPEIIAESPIALRGWKPQIDQNEWIINEIQHHLSDSGFTSQLSLETAPLKEEEQ